MPVYLKIKLKPGVIFYNMLNVNSKNNF